MEDSTTKVAGESIMPKLHISSSPFLSPIMTLVDDVHWVRPYAAQKLMGGHTIPFGTGKMPPVPVFWDGDHLLFLVDHRSDGEGGKFTGKNRLGQDRFPCWQRGLIWP